MKFSLSKVALILIWGGFFLSSWGSYLRIESSKFHKWLESVHSQYDDLPGAGLWLAYCWQCTGFIYLISTIFITFILFLREETSDTITINFFTIMFLFISFLILISALQSLFYVFFAIAIGQILLTIGILCGIARWHWL
ncbi:MAG: hypothetical protein QNJ54_06205 [Prochloraceae cyanobacterium]|nr:hypothetical protein [Prochloraceae cyanobacterium]